jgi:formylglycine-generating enzyme required for sulfatase activity
MIDTKKSFCPSHPNPLCLMEEGKGRCGMCGHDFSQQFIDKESRAKCWEKARIEGENKKALSPQPDLPPDPPADSDTIVSPPDPIVPPSSPEKKSKVPARLIVAGLVVAAIVGIASYGIGQDSQEEKARLRQQVTAFEAQVARLEKPAPAPAAEAASAPPAPAVATDFVPLPMATQKIATYRAGQVIAPDCAGCPEMVVILAGSFKMGSNDSDSYDDEKPVHGVTISRPFALGKTEVTQGQWKAVMGRLPPELHFKTCGDECPVEGISWKDAKDFIAKLNLKTGKTYRLPSEAEWEYACRAGGKHKYCGSDDVGTVAWYDPNSDGKTHPVAGKKPNDWGLYDMSGNVFEWVEDCFAHSYSEAPNDGSARQGCGSDGQRVLRGGSLEFNSRYSRAAHRHIKLTGYLFFNGFRLARMLP